MNAELGRLLDYRQLLKDTNYKQRWSISVTNESYRLENGVGRQTKGTNTLKLVHKHEVPHNRMKKFTYGPFMCSVCPKKVEQNRIRFTVKGNCINYQAKSAEILEAKSTEGAQFMSMDISNFYLMMPLSRSEYIRIKLSNIPKETINK